jgi:AraC-like DNA-binding protein
MNAERLTWADTTLSFRDNRSRAMPYLVRSACLTGYAELARSLGLDPFLLLKEAGLDGDCLFHPDSKISVDGVRRLWEVSARAARIDDFGLRLAGARPLSFLGPISLAMRDAATLREALESARRYLPLHHEAAVLSLEEMGDVAICKLEVLGGQGSPARQSIEMGLGAAHHIIRQLLGGSWRPRPVWFSHSAPANMTTHHNIFGPWVEFGRDCSGILLEAHDLDAPLPAADPMMARHVKQQYLEPMLAQVSVTLSKKVRQLVYELLPSGRCSAEQLASRLVMHPRTLHRYLAREGETCSSIVDAVRGDLARRYVEDQGRSLSEVSDLLGFSALSSFSRWFRTRFSCSPMSWRAARNPRLRASDQSA